MFPVAHQADECEFVGCITLFPFEQVSKIIIMFGLITISLN